MARLRRPVSAALAAILAGGLLTGAGAAASAATGTTTAAGGSDDLSVVELDLDGVEAAALPALPDPDSVPFAEEEPAAAAPDGAQSRRSQADAEPVAPAPGPTATASPAPSATPAPTASPAPAEPAEEPDGTAAAEPAPEPDVLTVEMETAPFTVLGVTWERTPDLDGVEIRYRVRVDGSWTDWAGVGATDVAPDADSEDAEGAERDGTDPIVAVGADGLQIWAEAETGTVTDLKAVLVDPGADPAEVGSLVDGTGSTAAAAAGASTADGATFRTLGTAGTDATVRTAALAQPGIISRAGWGADESLRGCTPDYSRSVVSAAVHHTASANGYSAAAVPGIIRGFYAYHTRPEAAGGRGWCDIGYNFLVDQYGRIFEGRAGGITSTVVGVHTGGFNSRTIGVSAIGDFSSYGPSPQLAESISQLIAWKFAVHRITANTNVTMVSGGGASRFPAGTAVTFNTIYAHRDAALTSCPGQSLYNLLPDIRNRVAQLSNATVAASPRWSLDALSATSSGIAVRGWAFDPNADTALPVRVSVDGAVQTLTANQSRPDVAAAYGVGRNHGFSGTVSAGNGRHLVCVTVGNVGAGQDVVVACDWVTVQNATPIGSLDAISTTPTSISVRGWALDPDTTASIGVHVYVDGKAATAVTANRSRPDVGRVHGRGDAHGFDVTVPATGGSRQVCLYLINQPAGANPVLTCRTVQVGNVPQGSLDALTVGPGSVTVRGWALDADTTAPIGVHVYVDGRAAGALTANGHRPDVGRKFGLGDAHGFSGTFPVADGAHRVCLYLINTPNGSNPALACRDVTVRNAAPFGSIDVARGTAGGVVLRGWALDPDTTAPIGVHVYVDGRAALALTANASRPDVGRAHGRGDAHGFDTTVPVGAGSHQVCLYLINQPAGANPALGCRTVTAS